MNDSPDPAVASAAINLDLAETIDNPRQALRLCADMFLSYEAHHQARGAAPGVSLRDAGPAAAKAATNRRMASMCLRVMGLTQTTATSDVHESTEQELRGQAVMIARDSFSVNNPPSTKQLLDRASSVLAYMKTGVASMPDDPILRLRDFLDKTLGGERGEDEDIVDAAIRLLSESTSPARSEYRRLVNQVGTDCKEDAMNDADAPTGGTPLYQLRREQLDRIRDRLEAGKWATSAGQPNFEDFDLAIADVDEAIRERETPPPECASIAGDMGHNLDGGGDRAGEFTDGEAAARRANPGADIGHASALAVGQPGDGRNFRIGEGFVEGEEGLRLPPEPLADDDKPE